MAKAATIATLALLAGVVAAALPGRRANKEQHGNTLRLRTQRAPPVQTISRQQLIDLEAKYGGWVKGVRSATGLPHSGGDRFNPAKHDYGQMYADHLNWLLQRVPRPNVLEIGILSGSGVATWAEVFPQSHIYGFDIDLSNTQKRELDMVKAGFRPANAMLAKFDQMIENSSALVQDILGGDTLSFVMDDGCHTPHCALNTWRSVSPFLTGTFLYVIEDGAADEHVQGAIKKDVPNVVIEVQYEKDNPKKSIVMFTREEETPLPVTHMHVYNARQQEDDAGLRNQQIAEVNQNEAKLK